MAAGDSRAGDKRHVGLGADLARDDVERRVDALVQIEQLPFLLRVGMREILQVLHDIPNPAQPVHRFGKQGANVLAQVGRIDLVAAPLGDELVVTVKDSYRWTRGSWELSSDRANVVRALLGEFGLADDRIKAVSGRSTSDPFFPNDPYMAANERIEITLLYETPPVPADLKP